MCVCVCVFNARNTITHPGCFRPVVKQNNGPVVCRTMFQNENESTHNFVIVIVIILLQKLFFARLIEI